MRVRLAHTVTGLRNGTPWPPRGEVVDLPDEEAVHYLSSGIVVPADEEVETAAVLTTQSARSTRTPKKT